MIFLPQMIFYILIKNQVKKKSLMLEMFGASEVYILKRELESPRTDFNSQKVIIFLLCLVQRF